VPFNPVADRHTGQHNYTVVEAEAGQEINFTLHLANLEPQVKRIELMVAASWQLHPKPLRHEFSARPSLSGPIDAIIHSTNASDQQLWAQRAAIIERTNHPYNPLPPDEVHGALKLGAITPGEVKRSAAIVAPPDRFGSVASSFTSIGDPVELKPQQQAKATFSITAPRRPPHPWLVVHLVQVAGGAIAGGYTLAIGSTERVR
jgi:hypothetical protein